MNDAVSIIIPTYNRVQYLPASIESVLAQTHPRTEVIVVNDGSTDETEAALSRFRDRILYLKQQNSGKSAAVNLGLKRASGDYIWVFDDDDIAYPDKLSRHIDLFKQHPDIGFSHSAYHLFEGDKPDTILREVPAPQIPSEDLLRHLILAKNVICGASVVARRACYETAGLFDERLVRSQDYDMWIRLARHFKAGAILEPTVNVREHAGDRGSASDRFGADQMGQKQHQYHRIVFKKVYGEIPLEELFGDLGDPAKRFEALVERVWMAMKRYLVEESLTDLGTIETILRQHPEIDIPPPAFRCFCLLEDVAIKKEYPNLADHLRRILSLRGLVPTGRPQITAPWNPVSVAFGT